MFDSLELDHIVCKQCEDGRFGEGLTPRWRFALCIELEEEGRSIERDAVNENNLAWVYIDELPGETVSRCKLLQI